MTSAELLRHISQNSDALRLLFRHIPPIKPVIKTVTSTEPAKSTSASVVLRPSIPSVRPFTSHSGKRRGSRLSKSRTEATLNEKVLGPLSALYGSRITDIIDQAESAYFYRNPQAQTRPETYELYEGNFLDEGIRALGLKRWVIGRPKLS